MPDATVLQHGAVIGDSILKLTRFRRTAKQKILNRIHREHPEMFAGLEKLKGQWPVGPSAVPTICHVLCVQS